MPSKKGTQKQKQKQKQKQTVIVNINEKPKTRRRRTTLTIPKQQQQQKYPSSVFNPVINNKTATNNDVRDLLYKLSKEQQTNNSIMSRVIATQTANPQSEVILDKQEEAKLPNRPAASMSSNDAELIRLRAITAQQTPFSFSTAEAQTDDLRRVQDRMEAPTIPFNAYLGQKSEHQTSPKNQIHIDAGPSGESEDPIGELDYDAMINRQPDAEVAKDNQEFFDYMKSIGISTSASREEELIRQPERAPTLAEKAGFPVAEARFTSPEAPEAFARPAVAQAGAKKVNPNTDSRLQLADFRNVGEAQEAIKTWNTHQDKSERIKLTKDTGGGGYKTLGELENELASKNLTFPDIKTFHVQNTLVSPRKVKERKAKK